MKFTRSLLVLLGVSLAAACSQERASRPAPDQPEVAEYVESQETRLPANPSKRRLPASVRIISDTEENFGIGLSGLAPDQVSIVRSAWVSYEKILSGGYPDCPEAPFAPADGGTTIYFCDGYDIARVHGLSGTTESPGYDYGPSLNFLNGQHIERLKFYTQEEMARLDRAAP